MTFEIVRQPTGVAWHCWECQTRGPIRRSRDDAYRAGLTHTRNVHRQPPTLDVDVPIRVPRPGEPWRDLT